MQNITINTAANDVIPANVAVVSNDTISSVTINSATLQKLNQLVAERESWEATAYRTSNRVNLPFQ